MQRVVLPVMRLVHYVLLNLCTRMDFRNLNTSLISHWSNFVSEICSRCTLFHLCEVVQIFQQEFIFPYLSVPGRTNLGGSIFTMTVATICLTIEHLQFRDEITELQMLRSVAYFTEYIMVLPIYQFSSRK